MLMLLKKILCLLLSLWMLLSLVACAAGGGREDDEEDSSARRRHERSEEAAASTESPEPAAPVFPFSAPEPTNTPQPAVTRSRVELQDIPDDLMLFLSHFAWYTRTGADSYTPSDAQNAAGILNNGFELIVNYDAYPGPEEEFMYNQDPLGRWSGCYVYDAEKTDRILKTVFHVSDASIADAREAGNADDARYYYYDGSYYLPALGVGGGYVCYPCYAESDGDNLCLYYAVYAGDVVFYPAGIQYALVSKADMDGKDVWTLSYWSRTLPSLDTAGSSPDFSAFSGDWVLEDDGLSSLLISDYHDSAFHLYAGFFRLIGFEADASFAMNVLSSLCSHGLFSYVIAEV